MMVGFAHKFKWAF